MKSNEDIKKEELKKEIKGENMQAYLNNPELKAKVLADLKRHYDADEIVQGVYWENGKGCAVGCILHDLNPEREDCSNHTALERELGIPSEVAALVDRIFELLPNKYSKHFPIECMSAIEVGKDLSHVWPKMAIWILDEIEKFQLHTVEVGRKVKDIYVNLLKDTPLPAEEIKEINKAAHAAATAAHHDAIRAAAKAATAAVRVPYDAGNAAAYAADYAIRAAYYAFSDNFIIKMKDAFIDVLKA